MEFRPILQIINYGLVLIYGLLLSTHIACGPTSKIEKQRMIAACPLLLMIQCAFSLIFGIESTRLFYPLISHLPLVIILVLALEKPLRIAIVSVLTAYLCCQLPRWITLLITHFFHSDLLGEISYTFAIIAIYLLLRRYFVRIAADAITYSPQNLYLFGSLPFVYYVFDYSTVIYSNTLYAGIPLLTEFFPTAFIVFYVVFLASYHKQTQKRTQAELQKSMLEVELKQSDAELESLRRIDTQTAIYQHNMRHHLTAINGYLSSGSPEEAKAYIKKVQADIDAFTPKRFCENELVNLLCSSFSSKAEKKSIQLTVDARLPKKLSVSDTELCTILSNGLENALHAVAMLEEPLKWTELHCGIHTNKILIEIKNPYAGEISMHDGLPVSNRMGHGYGCRSIQSIVESHGGHCTFEAEHGIFTLRIMLLTSDLK